MPYFFDTYALMEIIRSNKSYLPYEEEEIFTSLLNLGELYHILLKNFDEDAAEKWRKKLEGSYMAVTEEVIIKAMKFKYEQKNKNFSFIDCVGYILAEENSMKFLTGNKEFEEIKNVEFVK